MKDNFWLQISRKDDFTHSISNLRNTREPLVREHEIHSSFIKKMCIHIHFHLYFKDEKREVEYVMSW